MRIKEGAVLAGLHPIMRAVLREAERIWKDHGRAEGVTVTAGTDGAHSAVSWHYYGFAIDLRTRYFDVAEANVIEQELKESLPGYDVVHHINKDGTTSHIHVEIGNSLAGSLGVLY